MESPYRVLYRQHVDMRVPSSESWRCLVVRCRQTDLVAARRSTPLHDVSKIRSSQVAWRNRVGFACVHRHFRLSSAATATPWARGRLVWL
jgi:hypothetical protein